VRNELARSIFVMQRQGNTSYLCRWSGVKQFAAQSKIWLSQAGFELEISSRPTNKSSALFTASL